MGIIIANDDSKRWLQRNCSELLLQPLLSERWVATRTVNTKMYELGLVNAWIENRSILCTMNGALLDNWEFYREIRADLFVKIVYKIVALKKKEKGLWIENCKSIRRVRTIYIIIYPLHARIRLSLIKRKCVTSAWK